MGNYKGNKRDRTDIEYDILMYLIKQPNKEDKKTRLMFAVNIIHNDMNRFILDLGERGLISNISNKIQITNDGIDRLLNLHLMRFIKFQKPTKHETE